MRGCVITQSRISFESTLSARATSLSISSRVVHRRTSNVRHGSGPVTGALLLPPAWFGSAAIVCMEGNNRQSGRDKPEAKPEATHSSGCWVNYIKQTKTTAGASIRHEDSGISVWGMAATRPVGIDFETCPHNFPFRSTKHNTRSHTRQPTLSSVWPAVEVKRLVVATNRDHAEATVGREVGRSVNVRGKKQQAHAQAHRCRTLLQEPFLGVLRKQVEMFPHQKQTGAVGFQTKGMREVNMGGRVKPDPISPAGAASTAKHRVSCFFVCESHARQANPRKQTERQ